MFSPFLSLCVSDNKTTLILGRSYRFIYISGAKKSTSSIFRRPSSSMTTSLSPITQNAFHVNLLWVIIHPFIHLSESPIRSFVHICNSVKSPLPRALYHLSVYRNSQKLDWLCAVPLGFLESFRNIIKSHTHVSFLPFFSRISSLFHLDLSRLIYFLSALKVLPYLLSVYQNPFKTSLASRPH